MSAGVLGYLDGRPVPRTRLDRRVAALRGGPRSGVLPAPGSAEDRQLVRWIAQVILTELLCAAEAERRGLDLAAAPSARLDQRAAVEFGSITAAAFAGSAAVRAVYRAVTADVTVPAAELAAYRAATARPPAGPLWRLSGPGGVFEAAPATLPADLAGALQRATSDRVTVAGWTADRLPVGGPAAGGAGGTDRDDCRDDCHVRLTAAARRAVFVRWLDRARADRLRLVPGLEHPGDPRQPDNHHRH